MALVLLDLGTTEGDGTGTPGRDGGQIINDNFTEAFDHIADTNNPHSVTAAQVGLGNVGNYAALALDGSTTMTAPIGFTTGNGKLEVNSVECLALSSTASDVTWSAAGSGLAAGSDLNVQAPAITGSVVLTDGLFSLTINPWSGVEDTFRSSGSLLSFGTTAGTLFKANANLFEPGTDAANIFGSGTLRWKSGKFSDDIDFPSTNAQIQSGTANDANARALIVDTDNSLSDSAARLLSLRNQTLVKFEVDAVGNVIIGGGTAEVDYTLTFDGETNDGTLTYMEDEDRLDFSMPIQVPSFTRDNIIRVGSVGRGVTAPAESVIGTALVLIFNADAETVYIPYEIPSDWDGASDLALEIHWLPVTGIPDTETVKFDISYRTKAHNEAIDAGTATTATVTYTQSGGAGTAKEHLDSSIVIDYDDANNPVTVGDIILIAFNRDMTTDTFGGDIGVAMWHIEIDSNTIPKG